MTSPQKPSNVLHRVLWIVQLLVATNLLWAAALKWFQPLDQLAAMWPWAGQIPAWAVKLTGLADFLGALGLILPAGLRLKPYLTPVAALGVVALMISAGIFHLVRGETAVIGVNVVFALLAAFVAWGRFRLAPIQPSKTKC